MLFWVRRTFCYAICPALWTKNATEDSEETVQTLANIKKRIEDEQKKQNRCHVVLVELQEKL